MTTHNIIAFVLIGLAVTLFLRYAFLCHGTFISIKEIISNYWKIFHGSISDILAFSVIPTLLSIGLTLLFSPNDAVLEIISTTVSILLGLLFATLGALAGFPINRSGWKEGKYNNVFNETVAIILFLALISLMELLLIFCHTIAVPLDIDLPQSFLNIIKFMDTFMIYDLAFSILMNCLIVLKRIERLIQRK